MRAVPLWLALLIIASGCATAPVDRSFSPELAATARSAKVYVIVPQDKVVGPVMESTAGTQFGLIGALVDVWETSSAYKAMYRRLAPLHKAAADVDFRGLYLQTLRGSGLFANPAAMQLAAQPPRNHDERKALIASAAGTPVMLVEVRHQFDVSYRFLTIESRASLWTGPQGEAAHSVTVTYHSMPVSPDRSWDPARRSIPLWSADGARRYRAAVKEGIDESVSMLRIALDERPANVPTARDQEREFVDYTDLYHRTRKGKPVRPARDRRTLLTANGEFHSVSTGPTFASTGPAVKSPGPGLGRVFFYRLDKQDPHWIQPTVYANGIGLGELCVDNVSFVDLRPGKYTFALKYDGDAPGATIARSQIEKITSVTLIVQPGARYFMRFDGYGGIFTKTDSLKLLTANVAEPEVLPLRLGGWVR